MAFDETKVNRRPSGSDRGGEFAPKAGGGGGSGRDGSGGDVKSSEPNKKEKMAIQDYCGDMAVDMNRFLRGDDLMSDAYGVDRIESGIETLDSLMARQSFPEEVTVYRSLWAPSLGSVKPGDVFMDKGFTSTSRSEDVAKGFGFDDEGEHLMVIKVPKGAKAIDVSNISDASEEQEVLIARGNRMKIVSIDQSARIIQAELLLAAE